MNRIVLWGLALFFGLVGLGLIGEPRTAKGGHGLLLYGGFSCHGWNRCHGGQRCYGCSGCYGCYGTAARSCYGCEGCGCQGCYGCQGWHGCYGCHGCYGSNGNGCHGCYGCAGDVPMMPAIPVPAEAAPRETWTPAPAQPSATAVPAQAAPTSAHLRVELPAEAGLVVGEFNTQSAGNVRYFQSPPLAQGRTYAYELRAEISRDGRVFTETKTVVVTAGQTLDVTFAPEETYVADAGEQ
jgi:uncharacterized protein (TIGR03000 family)